MLVTQGPFPPCFQGLELHCILSFFALGTDCYGLIFAGLLKEVVKAYYIFIFWCWRQALSEAPHISGPACIGMLLITSKAVFNSPIRPRRSTVIAQCSEFGTNSYLLNLCIPSLIKPEWPFFWVCFIVGSFPAFSDGYHSSPFMFRNPLSSLPADIWSFLRNTSSSMWPSTPLKLWWSNRITNLNG